MEGKLNVRSDVNPKTDTEDQWLWMMGSDLKIERESVTCAFRVQALRTNNMKFRMDNTADSYKCRMSGGRWETV